MAGVSSNVLVKLFETRVQRADDIAALEAEAEARHHHELEAAIARHPGEEDDQAVDPNSTLARMKQDSKSVPPRAPATQAAPKIGRNDLCPCGSGKKFKKCHGAALEEEGEDEEQAPV
jgi:preprotein translocase subunit SecA